jgi:hypothetical protein
VQRASASLAAELFQSAEDGFHEDKPARIAEQSAVYAFNQLVGASIHCSIAIGPNAGHETLIGFYPDT